MSLSTVPALIAQGRAIAQIAIRLPERPNSGDVLGALNAAYAAGLAAATTSAAHTLARRPAAR